VSGPPPGTSHSLLGRIGLQLYTVRRPLSEDFEGTLLQVGEMGYDEVEFAGYFDRSPSQVREALSRAGLDSPAAHVGFDRFGEGWHETLETAAAVGHRWVVVAWLPDEVRGSSDSYRRVAERFNEAGEAAGRMGLRFAYHNHAFEFERTPEGDVPLDLLLEETEPDLVDFEMDVYWVVSGGADPLDYIERFPGRFPLAHFKDMDEDGEMVDVGAGTIDFPGILARRKQSGLVHAFVEHDHPADPMASVRASHEYLAPLISRSCCMRR